MKYIVLIIFFLFVHSSSAHNPYWTQLDKRIIKRLVGINKDSTCLIEEYFGTAERTKNKTNLGFGWTVWSPSRAGGNISISSDFYYFNDSLVAFQINAELPDETTLRDRYTKWYNHYFEINEHNELTPYFFKIESVYSPLKNIDENLKSIPLKNQLITLMKPTSSLYYYWAGGYSGGIPLNRKLFLENAESLSFDELKYMTYSKNPITRFMAIEEIIRKNYIETNCTSKDLEWYDQCYKEVPLVKTLNGCLGSAESSENLVYMFSQMKYR